MGIDASIYGQLKPVEMPSYLDSEQKTATLSGLAMQQKRMGSQIQTEDAEAKRTAHLQKASDFGNALHSLSGLAEPERAQAYGKVRADLVSRGVVTPDKMPEQYDPAYYGSTLNQFMKSKEGIETQLKQAGVGKAQADIAHTKAQTSKTYADIAKEKAGAGPNGGKSFEHEASLRREWTGLPTTKATQDVAQSIERVRSGYKNVSAAGDLSLIFSYMKLLDPGSTVREGEFANAQNAGSAFDKIGAIYNKVARGERLTDDQRHDFASQAENVYAGQLNTQKTVDDQYAALAQRYGVSPDVVMMKFPKPQELKKALAQESEKPGWFANLFGGKPVQASTQAKPPSMNFDSMSDADVTAQYQKWKQSQGAQ